MKDQFINWQIQKEGKKKETANAYSNAIDKISENYTTYIGRTVDIFLIKDLSLLKEIVDLYGLKGKYKKIGDVGHGTNRNALKTYYRFKINRPKTKISRVISPKKSIKNYSNQSIDKFDSSLITEALEMRKHYQTIYCLERSIRDLIVELMKSKFGDNWWHLKIPLEIKNSVLSNMKMDLNTGYTKRSDRNIDYTTFGDLRKIVKNNWPVFADKFISYNAFNSIMIALNRLRVPIAHCTPLVDDEVLRLNLTVKDWFRLIKK